MANQPHFFLAVPIPNDLRQQLKRLSDDLKKRLNYRYWTHLEDFHITCVFLGAVPDDQIKQLILDLKSATKDIAPFSIQLDRLGSFGSHNKPRVIYGDVKADEPLYIIQDRVSKVASSLGFQIDQRPYHPHVTIAKKWNDSQPITNEDLLNSGSGIQLNWMADQLILYQVFPNRTPRYSKFERFLFEGDN